MFAAPYGNVIATSAFVEEVGNSFSGEMSHRLVGDIEELVQALSTTCKKKRGKLSECFFPQYLCHNMSVKQLVPLLSS